MSKETGDLSALLSAAISLGATDIPGWSEIEQRLVEDVKNKRTSVAELRNKIRGGADPLGEAFCGIRSAQQRRPLGQTYTPQPVVRAMVEWAAKNSAPDRVVDPGVGSARYLAAAGRRWKAAQLVGVDIDPVATILARGHLAAAGFADRSEIKLLDYRKLSLPKIEGSTLYIGNPPYVRHHQISSQWKEWLVREARKRKISASQLAGLHVHFFLATVLSGKPGDIGVFVTSAEWLDVNYGRLIRELLLDGLGGQAVHVLDPTIEVFPDAITTAAITCFGLGSRPTSLRLRRVQRIDDLGALEGGRKVSRARLNEAARWSPLIRVSPKLPDGYVELGEFCRVHRGQVTGGNGTWIVRRGKTDLPDRVLFPTVTRARELFEANDKLVDDRKLRLVIDLPPDLDQLFTDERDAVESFLRQALADGAADGYIARTRRAWWSVGLRTPAPILATYMARRPPAFVRNVVQARHINIAHGLYPREEVSQSTLDRLAKYLRVSVSVGQGRTYAGGLTKFEPREMERLPVPAPEVLSANASDDAACVDGSGAGSLSA